MNTQDLKKGLNKRHIFFIALGSAIGTGLFLGSATAIKQAGPSVLFAYMIAGLAIFVTMRAMGEMALQVPRLQTFGSCATHFISPFAGFITGWAYVTQMVFVCLADITAFATYMQFWYPNVSPWVWTLALACLICAINLSKVNIFGELEFYFSIIKVVAIIAMIIGGIYLVYLGFQTGTQDFKNIDKLLTWSYWFPHNWVGFTRCMAIVIYAFGGIEVIGITAAEAKDPEKTIPKAMNVIPFRIVFFYVMTLAVLFALYPWQEVGVNGSPFVNICNSLGFHYASNILNIIVLTAAASAINSDIYGSSRMIYSLAKEGQALHIFDRLNKNGTPSYAIFLMLAIMSSGIIFNYIKHDGLFEIMADMAAVTSVIGWFMIILSEVFMRKKMPVEEREKLKFPVPLWPISSYLALAFMVCVIIIMFFCNTSSIYLGAAWVAFIAIVYNSFKYFDTNGKFVHRHKLIHK